MKKSYLFVLAFLILTPLFASDGDQLVGVWKPSEGRSLIKIDKIGNKYYGRIVWLKSPKDENDEPRKDVNNPDESLRETPLRGYRILKDFEYDPEEKLWVGGTIYDPRNGSTYDCKIELKDDGNTIEVRGFIGAAVFGRTDTWTRMKKK
ncbi:MAG: DUF2147 domain-containing protein [Bacteroidota bacterium]